MVYVNQGLITLALLGVEVNLVLFLTRVVGKDNAAAANDVTKWTGTLYMCSLLGAFLSDSFWGRYKTCAIFQAIFIIGLILLSLSSYLFLVKPSGCGGEESPCKNHSSAEIGVFYVSIYLVALGNGGYQPLAATFGADQFDEEDPKESESKVAFFSYFYFALNLGCLFSTTILTYVENKGMWALGFCVSAASAIFALILFLVGSVRYRHFVPKRVNPFSRFCQVIVAATRNWRVEMPINVDEAQEDVHDSHGLKFLDKAALKIENHNHNPWRVCTMTQVEEAKCIVRLLPIWLCTIPYSVMFTQLTSLFVVQGSAMKTSIPPASMVSFDIVAAAAFILFHRNSGTCVERMGAGLIIAALSMAAAGVVEHFRLRNGGNLSIMWQVPQYVMIGISETYMLVAQLELFNQQAPDGLRSFGSALSMASIALGNYLNAAILTIVTKLSTTHAKPGGWIPATNLNNGHLDLFFYLLAALAVPNFLLYYLVSTTTPHFKIRTKTQYN
ncbi:hypothetical protein ACS0TY_003440 [Phlomoides rotata]